MEVYILNSGSNGNAVAVFSDSTGILFDCGLSCKQIRLRLDAVERSLEDMDAIFISHQHSDHMRGLRVTLKHTSAQLYSDNWTLWQKDIPPELYQGRRTELFPSRNYRAGDLTVTPYEMSHDVTPTYGFEVTNGHRSVCIFTDTGRLPAKAQPVLRRSNLILLESNYDDNMLTNGPYPLFLKRRIKGHRGHLCNEQSADALQSALGRREVDGGEMPSNIVLGHLSENNNSPELAYKTAKTRIEIYLKRHDIRLATASRYEPTGPFLVE